MVTKTGPADPTPARIRRAIRAAGDRYRTRRAVWRLAQGDPDRYRQLMAARLGAGYIHYEDDPPARPSEWRRLVDRLIPWVLAGAVMIAAIILLDHVPVQHHGW